jgi:hypothetical protein
MATKLPQDANAIMYILISFLLRSVTPSSLTKTVDQVLLGTCRLDFVKAK